VYENTPVTEVKPDTHFILKTPKGAMDAEKIVFATNAYSHLIPQLKRKQVPAFTHMVVTEPLSDQQMASTGWKNRQGLEDARNLMHYFRLTADNRIAMGGRDVSLAFGSDMQCDMNERIFVDLERDVVQFFPSLEGIHFTHRWGGPLSATLDLAPAIGYIGDKRAVYSLGYIGHGVSMTHLNGWTLSDMILERKTDLTDVWFVNRRTIPWPPEPLRMILSQAIRGYLRIEDALYERRLHR
jgi:glycine/D-amino acid oxidase-like deaminating enzyme